MQTKRYLRTPVLSLAVLSGLFSASTLYGPAYMKLGDIKGEVADAGHQDEIEILSWSWGMSNALGTVGGGGGAGKATFKEFTFVKQLDKSSPKLAESVALGAVIPEARFVLAGVGATGGPDEYLTVILSEVVVTSLDISGGSGEERASEQITLNYTKVEFSYTPRSRDGSVEPPVVFAWDVAANTPIDPTGN